MLIALLAILGIDLIVLVALGASLFARTRWLKRQPGSFRGAIRVSDGEVDGLGSTWRRGYARWVRDVLVWTKAPLLLRHEILGVDGIEGERTAAPGEVKRLGDGPIVVGFVADRARIEIAVNRDDRNLLHGRGVPANTAPAVHADIQHAPIEATSPTAAAPGSEL